MHQAVPAIAAGCPVVVKPAATTPLSCLHLTRLAHEAGLPPAWFQVRATVATSGAAGMPELIPAHGGNVPRGGGGRQTLVCDNAVAERLVTDTRVAFFSFIGSARVGWHLRSKLAPGVRCALEHGGAAPVIVLDDDIPGLVPALIKGASCPSGRVSPPTPTC